MVFFLVGDSPVIAITPDAADDFIPGNIFHGLLKVGNEPILGGNWSRRTGGLVLVIIHDHQSIRVGGKLRVIVVFISHRDVYVQLHSMVMKIVAEFTNQRTKAGLRVQRNFLKINGCAFEAVAGQKRRDLVAEVLPGRRIVQEVAYIGKP